MEQTVQTADASGAASVPLAEAVEEQWFDNFEAGEYPDDLYHYVGTAEGIADLAAFDAAVEAQFRDEGYAVVRRAFSPAQTEGALQALLDLIDGRRPDFKGVQFESSARAIIPTLSPEQKQDYVRKLNAYVEFDDRLKAIAEYPPLLAVVTRLLGETPSLFANQAMLKPPLVGREKPWHQDHGFFKLPAGTPIVGVWIALDQALPDNGCMHVIPGGHREARPHFTRRDWQICDDQIERQRILAVPLQPGGCLFFDGLLPHGTPATKSPRRRRALQLHYVPASVVQISQEEHQAVFSGEARGVSC